jgi:hypothetical protein
MATLVKPNDERLTVQHREYSKGPLFCLFSRHRPACLSQRIGFPRFPALQPWLWRLYLEPFWAYPVASDSFDSFFQAAMAAMDRSPYHYQRRLATEPIQSCLIDVPTGAGKTAAAMLAWLWRLRMDPENTPRRFVYCLPRDSWFLCLRRFFAYT